MKRLTTTLKTLTILPFISAMCFSAATHAANPAGASVRNIGETNIYVESNGSSYTGIKRSKHPTNIHLQAVIDAYAPKNYRINSWKVGLVLQKYGHSFVPSLESNVESLSGVYGESYSSLKKSKRPRTILKEISLIIANEKLDAFGSQVCNTHASNLQQQGVSLNVIHQQNHTVETYHVSTAKSVTVYSAELGTHFQSGLGHPTKNINIVCMKAPAQPVATPVDLQTSSAVTDASLSIAEQSTLGGSCKINLSSVIKTNLPNTTVKYRFEHSNGKKSDLKTVKTDHSKTAMDTHWYNVPKNPNGEEAGSLRIIGVSHDFQSTWKSYSMTCNEGSPNSVSLVPEKPILKDFSLLPLNRVMHNGMMCPTKLRVTARIMSKKAFSGLGNITMKSNHFSFATHDVNLEPFMVWQHAETFDLKPWNTINSPVGNAGGSNTWQTQPSSGQTIPSQRFELRYTLSANNQHVIRSPYKTISVSCTAPQVNPNVLPTQSQELNNAPNPNTNKQKVNKIKAVPMLKLPQPTKTQPKVNKRIITKPALKKQ